MKRTLRLRAESVRLLTCADLELVASGVPSSFPQCLAARATRSEADGAGPCPGEYSWTCSP